MGWQNERGWHNDRVFEAFITQEKIDKQSKFKEGVLIEGDKIKVDAAKEIMPWLVKYGVIHYKHSNLNFGEPLAWKVEGDKIKIKVGVHDNWEGHFPIYDDIWKEIKAWNNQGYMSIGGQSVLDKIECDGHKCWDNIEKLGIFEVSWVGDNPANTGANVDKVNMMAKEWQDPERMRDSLAKELYGKSFNELTDEEKQKVHNVATIAREKGIEQKSGEILQKPFGPWEDFDACLSDMKGKYDEETAKKVCGALKRDLEKGEVVKKKMEKEGEQEQTKIAPEEKKKQEVPGEDEAVDIKEVLAEIIRRLDALEGKGTMPEEETEEKSVTTPNEVSVKIKEGEEGEKKEDSEEADENKLEKAVEKILEKHKITVTPTDKPTQTQEDSGSKVSFNGILEKARAASNMGEFRQ